MVRAPLHGVALPFVLHRKAPSEVGGIVGGARLPPPGRARTADVDRHSASVGGFEDLQRLLDDDARTVLDDGLGIAPLLPLDNVDGKHRETAARASLTIRPPALLTTTSALATDRSVVRRRQVARYL